jgi:hypothetical protein
MKLSSPRDASSPSLPFKSKLWFDPPVIFLGLSAIMAVMGAGGMYGAFFLRTGSGEAGAVSARVLLAEEEGGFFFGESFCCCDCAGFLSCDGGVLAGGRSSSGEGKKFWVPRETES